jgi:hypothetical protein
MACNTTLNISSLPGFGEYTLPPGKSFIQMQTTAKTQRVAFAILLGVLAVASITLVSISITWAVFASMAFLYVMVKQILDAIGVGNRAPPTNEIFPSEKIASLPKLGEVSSVPCSGFPTSNGPDTQEWKEELIRSARKSIALSGCYCGGRVFDHTLDLIEEQMDLYPELTCSILSSDVYVTPENHEKVDALIARFQDRFSFVMTPELFSYVSPVTNDLSISSNHTKLLVIDYGVYFMLGGSGLTSAFAEQKGEEEPEDLEPKNGCFDAIVDSVFQMRAFRDMDFVFRSDVGGLGTRIYVELCKLTERMRFMTKSEMKTPPSNWEGILPSPCDRFDEKDSLSNGLKVACYTSGPDQVGNLFLEELIVRVENATTSIVIDHLYFHPPERLFKALVDASNRGVHITVLTNKNGSKSPGSHALYTERSRHFARSLFEDRPKENIELYEYDVPYTSLHKKVVVVDGKFSLFGSANMGKKSLENLDYELTMKVESESFATEVLASIEEDKEICVRVPDEEAYKTSFIMDVIAPIQSIPMHIV